MSETAAATKIHTACHREGIVWFQANYDIYYNDDMATAAYWVAYHRKWHELNSEAYGDMQADLHDTEESFLEMARGF